MPNAWLSPLVTALTKVGLDSANARFGSQSCTSESCESSVEQPDTSLAKKCFMEEMSSLMARGALHRKKYLAEKTNRGKDTEACKHSLSDIVNVKRKISIEIGRLPGLLIADVAQ